MENILIATDFTESSKNAGNYAANLAGYFGANLTLFHAYHAPITNFETGYIPPITDMRAAVEGEMKNYYSELKSVHKTIDIEYILEMGFAADMVEEIANQKNCDLIVLGISGQNSVIKEHLIGSVATKIAQESKVPVLIVPEHCRFKKVKNIAFACDFDKNLETNDTLVKVKYFVSLFDAELEIINVMDPHDEISEEKAEVDVYVEKKLINTKHKTFFIYEKNVDEGILEFLDNNRCDLLITSPKKHNIFHDLFIESHTKRLAFHSPVPLLTIHD